MEREKDEDGMLWKYPEGEADRLPPLVLAYIGDAVFELYVRSRLAAGGLKVRNLHRGAVGMVSARAMAEYFKKLEPHLEAAEADIMRRGRNAKTRQIKSAGVGEYHRSTGFEALVGYLFLSRQGDRLAALLELAMAPGGVEDVKDDTTQS